LLASAFWHASVLDNLGSEIEAKLAGDDAQIVYHPKRQWVYQDREQESEYGFDFGIVTSLPDDKVKITVFQAKRPASEEATSKISIGHRVRETIRPHLPATREDLDNEINITKQKINSALIAGTVSKQKHLRKKLVQLRSVKKNLSKHLCAMDQRHALQKIVEAFKKTPELKHIVDWLFDDHYVLTGAIRRDVGSLFNNQYSYLQSEAFLALATQGWTHISRASDTENWCHYVQWVNGRDGHSWSASIQDVLRLDGCPDGCSSPFARVLANALSPSDESIGLTLPICEVETFASDLLEKAPNLTWGVTADTLELARELLLELGCQEAEIVNPLRVRRDVEPQHVQVQGTSIQGNTLG